MPQFKSKKDLMDNGQGYIHESMDRLSIIQSNLEDYVIKHPVATTLPAIKEKLEQAALLLGEAYQDIGQLQRL